MQAAAVNPDKQITQPCNGEGGKLPGNDTFKAFFARVNMAGVDNCLYLTTCRPAQWLTKPPI